jgi:hypothetical protein
MLHRSLAVCGRHGSWRGPLTRVRLRSASWRSLDGFRASAIRLRSLAPKFSYGWEFLFTAGESCRWIIDLGVVPGCTGMVAPKNRIVGPVVDRFVQSPAKAPPSAA